MSIKIKYTVCSLTPVTGFKTVLLSGDGGVMSVDWNKLGESGDYRITIAKSNIPVPRRPNDPPIITYQQVVDDNKCVLFFVQGFEYSILVQKICNSNFTDLSEAICSLENVDNILEHIFP